MKGNHYADAMSTPRVESVPMQDGCASQHFSDTSNRTLLSLPPVAGHLQEANIPAGRHNGKLQQWSRFSDSQLSSSLPDCRSIKLPELTEQPRTMTSRRPPLAHAAVTTQRLNCPRKNHWTSELPTYNHRSWRQSMDSVSRAVPAWSENGNCQSDTSRQYPSTGTTLRKSSSMGRFLLDTSVTPMIATKASLSMNNLTDEQPMVIIVLNFYD